MDILAALKAEEPKLQQQLDTIHAAMKLVNKEGKSAGGKEQDLSASLDNPSRCSRHELGFYGPVD